MKLLPLATLLEQLVEEVVNSVSTHDLVGHICTQHDLLFILQDGGDETWPQVQPGGEKE